MNEFYFDLKMNRYSCYYKKCFFCSEKLKSIIKRKTYHALNCSHCNFTIYVFNKNLISKYFSKYSIFEITHNNFLYCVEIDFRANVDKQINIFYSTIGFFDNIKDNYCLITSIKEFKKMDLKKDFLKIYNMQIFL